MRISAFNDQNIMKGALMPSKDGKLWASALWHHNLDCEWFYDGKYLIQRENFRDDIPPRKYKVPNKAKIKKHDNPILPYEITIGNWPNDFTVYAKNIEAYE